MNRDDTTMKSDSAARAGGAVVARADSPTAAWRDLGAIVRAMCVGD